MKLLRFFISVVALESCLHAAPPTSHPVIPIIRPRSQELNRPLQEVGVCTATHILDKGPFYATLSASGFYEKTFSADHITRAFFGSSLQCSRTSPQYLHIQGSSFLGSNRDPKALLADYFYLPRDYDGTVSFNPKIENSGVDFDLYFGLNDVKEGLYLRIHSTIVESNWTLGMCEKQRGMNILDYPIGYFSVATIPAAQLLPSFCQYACGKAPFDGVFTQNLATITGDIDNMMTGQFTNYLDPLHYGKISCVPKKVGLADIRLELGKIVRETEDCHLGFNLQMVIPTGTKIKSKFLFEPTIGNGHHFELGGGVHGHYTFYRNEGNDTQAGWYSDFLVTYLFTTQQKRSFDLKNKPLSRYMLASHFTAGTKTFAAEISPVVNISTLDVDVKVGLQLNYLLLLHYQSKQWDFDLGYNLWYRSKENLKVIPGQGCCEPNPLCDATETNRWGLKGDARIYGYAIAGGEGAEAATGFVPLSSTESDATIYQGTNQVQLNCLLNVDLNPSIDNGILYISTTPDIPDDVETCLSAIAPAINTSFPPILLSCSDLDIRSLNSLSHKIFSHASYTWNWRDTHPFIGVGGSAEFGQIDVPTFFFAPSTWEIWLKTGISFD